MENSAKGASKHDFIIKIESIPESVWFNWPELGSMKRPTCVLSFERFETRWLAKVFEQLARKNFLSSVYKSIWKLHRHCANEKQNWQNFKSKNIIRKLRAMWDRNDPSLTHNVSKKIRLLCTCVSRFDRLDVPSKFQNPPRITHLYKQFVQNAFETFPSDWPCLLHVCTHSGALLFRA